MVLDLWCYEDLEEKDQSISELINDGGVCRTAPSTPGLLKSCSNQHLHQCSSKQCSKDQYWIEQGSTEKKYITLLYWTKLTTYSELKPITVYHTAARYSSVQCSALQQCAVKYNTQCSTLQCSRVHCNTVKCSYVHCVLKHKAMQHSAVKKVQCTNGHWSKIQHCILYLYYPVGIIRVAKYWPIQTSVYCSLF